MTSVVHAPEAPCRPGMAVAWVLLPAGLVAYLGFRNGGFFPGAIAVAAVTLCLAWLVRVTTAHSPFGGVTAIGVAGAGALALLAVWTLTSSGWSDASGRAVLEYQRTLLYLLVFALLAAVPGGARNVRAILRGLAAAWSAIVLAAVVARLYPDAFGDIALGGEPDRLTWPVGYWNALASVAAAALIAVVHLSADLREHRAVRVAAAAAAPAIAVGLYLTLSRAGIGVALGGLALLLVLGRSRGLATALPAIAPVTVLAVLAAIGVDALTSERFDAAAFADDRQGFAMRLALLCLAAAALRAAALLLDDRLVRVEIPRPRAAVRRVAGGLAVAALAVAFVAVDGPDRLERQWDRFALSSSVTAEGGDRLSEASANGRIELWEVGLDTFRAEPLHGTGAGTYAKQWLRERPVEFESEDAHSLYIEMLSDLGVVGLGLLLVALGAGVLGVLRRRRTERLAWSAVLAIVLCWLAQAGIDWLWEMPVTTVGALALLGLGTARATERPHGRALSRRPARVLAGLAALLLALTPVRAGVSQVRLDSALASFRGQNCARAADDALGSISALDARPEPFEVLGYCDVRVGREDLAVRMLEAALRRDPGSWELHYGLALTQATAGIDPRPELRRALRAKPGERLVEDALERMRGRSPERWDREARRSTLVVPAGEIRR